ncbi:MAG: SIR2-like domain protein [Candidatus Brocadiaceae bacterium]|nr:SIR2-like domain protein [Candidatus Brocadiaceae bacterium]
MDEFIHRVEDRSSLLMMTGHDVENGQLVEFFEFRHLTFQEFLAARAMVEGWHPGRKENDTLVSVLEPHFEEERWREVIPLAAVLGGKATEAQARPETIRAALDALVRLSDYYGENTFVPMLVRGHYGLDFQAASVSQFFTTQSPANDLRGVIALESVVWWQAIEEDTVAAYSSAAEGFLTMLEQSERLASCKGAMGITRFCSKLSRLRETTNIESFVKLLRKARVKLQQMIFAEQPQEQFVACQAIGTTGECRVLTVPLEPEAYSQIFHLWRRASSGSVRWAAGWCMIQQPVLPREVTHYESSVPSSKMKNLLVEYEQLDFWQEKPLALVCAWYAHAQSNGEITKRSRKLMQEVPQTANESSRRALRELLKHLGEDVE